MRVGVSTACFYPLETEKSLLLLAQAGIQGVEIFLNAYEELQSPFLAELEGILQTHRMQVYSIHPYTGAFEGLWFFSNYPRRYQEGLELYQQYFEATARLGAKVVVLHGAGMQNEIPWAEYFERFDRLAQVGHAFGVELCQENIYRCLSRSTAFISAMAKALPTARFVLDLKQAIRAQQDPLEMLQAMGGQCCHVHISDSRPGEPCLPIGKGNLDLVQWKKALKQVNFRGKVVLELYRENFQDLSELSNSYKVLKAALEEPSNPST